MKSVESTDQGLQVQRYVQPLVSKNKYLGQHGDEIKLSITAPPADEKANSHMLKFVAKQFGTDKQSIELKMGLTSRHKVVLTRHLQKLPQELSTFINSDNIHSLSKVE